MLENQEDTLFIHMKKQEVIDRLRKEKYRITNQRMIIIDILLEGNCTCCKEIYYKAIKVDSSIGAATIYRMINTLESIGVISRKNMYQICRDMKPCEHCACRVVMDDATEIDLSESGWRNVVENGLKACGMIKNQNLKSVEIIECHAGKEPVVGKL